MRIEPMTEGDIEQVSGLAGQLGYLCAVADLARRFERLRADPAHAVFVAREGGKVHGWIHVGTEPPSLLGEARAEVSGLVVHEKSRGQRVGQRLLAAAELWARQRHLKLMRIRTNVLRTDAHRFYAREGYQLQKSWHLFVKELG